MARDRKTWVVAALLGLILLVVAIVFRANSVSAEDDTAYASYKNRASVSLKAVSRDFELSHPDFGRNADEGRGRYEMIASDLLNSAGDPFLESTGRMVEDPFTDASGAHIISPRPYISALPGDEEGHLSDRHGGAVTSDESFGQWFNSVAGVNHEYRGTFTLTREADTYVFDGSLDDATGAGLEYTSEIETTFIYEADKDWYIDVATVAEVWVYIDGRLVIDGGGGIGSDGGDGGLPGGHFDIDIYSSLTDKEDYHKHQYDDAYDVTWIDIIEDAGLLFRETLGFSHPNPLRIEFLNPQNGGAGTFAFEAAGVLTEGRVEDDFTTTFNLTDLTRLRVDFLTLSSMSHTSPGDSQRDIPLRDGSFAIRMFDTMTGALEGA